jgi:four helix bundle protein
MRRPRAAGSGGFRNQFIYQKALNLVNEMLALSRFFPKDEKYALTSQIRRAATSISSNIAEGYRKNSTREYIHYLTIAYGSCGELQSQTDVAYNMKYITKDEYEAVNALEEEVSRLLWSSMETLKTKARGARHKAQGDGF